MICEIVDLGNSAAISSHLVSVYFLNQGLHCSVGPSYNVVFLQREKEIIIKTFWS